MLKRIIWILLGFPAVLLLVTIAVINREPVRLVLDPFKPENPALFVSMPFYYYLFGALVIGAVIGGAVTWLGQAHWRQRARSRAQEALRWQAEAERLSRERDLEAAQPVTRGRELTVAR